MDNVVPDNAPTDYPSPCNPKHIDAFVRGELVETDEFERHLESCATCRKSLDDHTAGPPWWNDARSFLSDDDLDCDSIAAISSTGHSKFDRSVSERHVLESLAPSDDPHMLGRIAGYEVVGMIGAGGMGVVLKAFDRALNRFVAIKVLAPHLAESAAARRRFAREAQAAAAIVHENVIAIHGVSEANGLPYLVMPYERGDSLQKRIDNQGILGLAEILRISMQTADGLAAAHHQGLVHRDIKPANLLLADSVERVAITDFGLARAVDDASLTRTGIIAGTPQYMSPEQASGESVDFRSDLFSLGSVMYRMCTGRLPFRSDTSLGVLRKITESTPTPIQDLNPEIPDWLCRVVQKLHAKSPTDRFQTAAEVKDLLEKCLAHVQKPNSVTLPAELSSIGRETALSVAWRSVIAVLLVGVVAIASLIPGWLNENDRTKPDTRSNLLDPLSISNVESAKENYLAPVDWGDPLDTEVEDVLLETERLQQEIELLFEQL